MKETKNQKYYLSHKPKQIHLKSCEHYRENFKVIKEKQVFINIKHPFCQECLFSTPLEKQKIQNQMLTGNGSHQALCSFLANVNQPDKSCPKYTLTTAEGTIFKMTFKNNTVKRLMRKYCIDKVIRVYGYPKCYKGKIVSIEVFAWKEWDGKPNYEETWDFIGHWSKWKCLKVQRDYTRPNIATTRFEKQGYLPIVNFRFRNTLDFIKKRQLWVNHCYKITAKRVKDELEIVKAIPFASPYPKRSSLKNKFNPKNLIL